MKVISVEAVAVEGLQAPWMFCILRTDDGDRLDFPVAISVGIVVLAIAMIGNRAGRKDGLFMVGFYLLYLSVLIAISISDDVLTPASIIVLGVILPVSVLTVAYLVFRTIRRPGPPRLDVPFVDR